MSVFFHDADAFFDHVTSKDAVIIGLDHIFYFVPSYLFILMSIVLIMGKITMLDVMISYLS